MIRLDLQAERSGLIVSDGEQYVQVTAGFIAEGLTGLAQAVIGLLQGSTDAVTSWDEEPGQYRWIFHCNGEAVHLRILWFDQSWTRISDEHGGAVFETSCRLTDLAGQTTSQLQRLIEAVGQGGQQPVWARGYLPVREHEALRRLIKMRKRQRQSQGVVGGGRRQSGVRDAPTS